MTADEEDDYVIAQANEPLDEDGRFVNERVTVRRRDEIIEVDAGKVDYMDVSPRQLISVATGMIPFLENDDANRALMGSNMQRQAVPLLVPEAPIVGTGMEYKAACDSGVVLLAKRGRRGRPASTRRRDRHPRRATAKSIAISCIKFARSNQGTCINQHPIVKRGRAWSRRARSSPTAPPPTRARSPWAATCSSAL